MEQLGNSILQRSVYCREPRTILWLPNVTSALGYLLAKCRSVLVHDWKNYAANLIICAADDSFILDSTCYHYFNLFIHTYIEAQKSVMLFDR
jgi:hypothetical protein